MKVTTDIQEQDIISKVPAVTLSFWIIKILATTLGETGGDALSMSMNLGYLISTGIFAGIIRFIYENERERSQIRSVDVEVA